MLDGLDDLQEIVRIAYERAATDPGVQSRQDVITAVIDSLGEYIVHLCKNDVESGEGKELGYEASKDALTMAMIKLCDHDAALDKFIAHQRLSRGQ